MTLTFCNNWNTNLFNYNSLLINLLISLLTSLLLSLLISLLIGLHIQFAHYQGGCISRGEVTEISLCSIENSNSDLLERAKRTFDLLGLLPISYFLSPIVN